MRQNLVNKINILIISKLINNISHFYAYGNIFLTKKLNKKGKTIAEPAKLLLIQNYIINNIKILIYQQSIIKKTYCPPEQ